MESLNSLLDLARKKYRILKNNRDLSRLISRAKGINFHRRNAHNIGDLKCGPAEYIDSLSEYKMIEIFRCRKTMRLSNQNVIVGGGGLLANDFFSKQISNIVASNPKSLVCWGAGQNTHDSETVSYPEVLKEFDLVGVRDDKSPYEWVPCASCLSNVFDEAYPITHDIVLYNHSDFSGLKDHGFPELQNSETDFRKIIRFLGSGNTVITTSYHGAYWATLLGRKAVVLNPFSSKFFAFRHPPELAGDHDWKTAINRALSYPGSLEECRQSNLAFSRKVQERIHS